jgi:hypothetical protein
MTHCGPTTVRNGLYDCVGTCFCTMTTFVENSGSLFSRSRSQGCRNERDLYAPAEWQNRFWRGILISITIRIDEPVSEPAAEQL